MDVIVIGLGAMGSAATSALARRGHKVLGLEQFHPGHDFGSSQGSTRIIRTAYYEHPDYVPLVRRSFQLWADLERRTQSKLLVPCPLLSIGPRDGELIRGVCRAASEHNLTIEPCDLTRYSEFKFGSEYSAVIEYESGILFVDRCVAALLDDAVGHGAELRFNNPVQRWAVEGSTIVVDTEGGEFRAERLIVTAGPWASAMLQETNLPLTLMRQIVSWLRPADEFAIERFPIFMADTPEGAFYGLPGIESDGLKIAQHDGEAEVARPDQIERSISAADTAAVRDFIRRHLPRADQEFVRSSTCIYTLTPDRHFVIDRHPRYPFVAIAAGFSGHGFKFAPAVGEILADLAIDGHTTAPIGLFRADRFVS